MKTLCLLIEDDAVESVRALLPSDKAWILPERYDTFRSSIHGALEAYRENPESFTPLNEAIARMDRWLEETQ